MLLGKTMEARALSLAALTVGGLTLLDYFIEAKPLFYSLYPGEIISFLIVWGHGGVQLADTFAPVASFIVNIIYYTALYEILLLGVSRFAGPSANEAPRNILGIRTIGLGIALLIAALAGLADVDYRQHRMNDLYRIAINGSLAQSAEACAAVVELAGFRGKQAPELLFHLLAPQHSYYDKRQDIALQLLAKRNDPEVTARLAELLQPYTSLWLRTEVSKALLDMECNRACTQFILFYLDRLSLGELNSEDATEHSPDFRFSLKAEQDEVVNRLGRVLGKDQSLTVAVLTDDYGIGTSYPSRLALQLIGTLQLRTACHELIRPNVKIYDPVLRGQVQNLIQQLKCPPLPGPH